MSKYMKYFSASCRTKNEHQIFIVLGVVFEFFEKKIKITDMKGSSTAIFFFRHIFSDLKFEF